MSGALNVVYSFERRKYSLVACNVTSSNAFFFRNDLLLDKFPCVGELDKLYQPAHHFLTTGLFDHLSGAGKISALVDCISD